ncbi:alanine racemase [Syntrophaceticus schinkii]|jgi:alanine racemase|uniref:Alanine racemase n=1 Tax=Syntrophaceticus schinkii TaxID=499207 RepID=A0A0B7MQM4_9FIRM|nr:alanine racemase [Syntrophaceticus schinkii]MDD2359327.1 alanine racemase [Syntrophaceticus schinkii]MDD4262338.1 alanine racemase [Syntrophaceticus schinkii]MDD4675327.1 alanine racemase [Syntrophaceticus schinkii]CEO90463.1 Alanine racemase [Syntrophaceticus schinkii]
MKRPVWAEIDLKALAGNVREIRRVTDESAQIMAIVKANGYGHGVEHVSRVALQNGASWIGVALLQEAILLREKGIKAPILVLGYTPVDDIAEVIRYDISQTVFTWDDALAIASVANHLGKKAKIHVKIDTGMGRLGFKWDRETLDIICRLAHLPGLEVEGIYTHFATADGDDKTFAQEQFARFQQILKQLAARHVFIRWRHCANSAAVMSMPFTHLDLVRPGITIYGLYPSSNSRDLVELTPVMSLKAKVAFVKEVPEMFSISYGRSYYTKEKTRIATVPLGYGDGYSRLLSNRGQVLIRGMRAPVVGRVCMDQLMVDVGHIPGVQQGDEVVLVGRQGSDEIPVEELADYLGTINYEVLCMISERVPRVYLNGDGSEGRFS